jgi:hypothetical protein
MLYNIYVTWTAAEFFLIMTDTVAVYFVRMMSADKVGRIVIINCVTF